MGFRPHPKNASVDPDDLYDAAWSTSDFNGQIYNHRDMVWQYQYAGPNLINLRYLVGADEADVPAEFLRTIILPPDPVPTFNARIENYADDENSYRSTTEDGIRATQNDDLRIVQIAADDSEGN